MYFKLLPDTIGYIRWNHSRKSSSPSCTFLRWNTSTTNYSRTKKWNHNPECWVYYAICSFKWCQQRWGCNLHWKLFYCSLYMSNKRTFNEDSSEEDTNNPLPAKNAATGPPAGEQSGTRVPKGRGGGDLPKISAFPDNTPKSGVQSPAWAPCFSTNIGEGSVSSAQGGRNRGPINRNPPLKPHGTIKTATKDKTKSKEKITPT